MNLLGKKWLFGSILMLSLVVGASLTVNAQADNQTAGKKKGGPEVCHLRTDGSVGYDLIKIGPGDRSSHFGHGDVEPKNGVCPSILSTFGFDRSSQNGKFRGQKSTNRGATTTTASASTSSQPATTAENNDKKVAICHREGEGVFHLNTISSNAVPAHLAHGDMYPEAGACLGGGTDPTDNPGGEPGATPEPVTILLFGAGLAGVGYAARRWRKTEEQ